jgi:hypothetical protein
MYLKQVSGLKCIQSGVVLSNTETLWTGLATANYKITWSDGTTDITTLEADGHIIKLRARA